MLGKSYLNGWNGDTYYQNVKPHRTYDINLPNLIESHNGLYLLTKRIIITVDRESIIKDVDFKIKLNASHTQ